MNNTQFTSVSGEKKQFLEKWTMQFLTCTNDKQHFSGKYKMSIQKKLSKMLKISS